MGLSKRSVSNFTSRRHTYNIYKVTVHAHRLLHQVAVICTLHKLSFFCVLLSLPLHSESLILCVYRLGPNGVFLTINLQWQTTWDRSKLLSRTVPSSPIAFGPPGPTGSADIVVDDTVEYQQIVGFGASLSKSHR